MSRPATIVFNGDKNFPPYEFVNEKGEPEGFDVDLAEQIFQRMGVDHRIEIKDWAIAKQELAEGKVDVACMMFTRERAKDFKFGPTIKYISLYAVFDKDRHSINGLSDFNGKRVAVERGTMSDEVVANQRMKCQLTFVLNLQKAIRDLSLGRYDVILCEKETAEYFIHKDKLHNLEIRNIGITPYELCFVGNNLELLNQMERTLMEMKKDGSYDQLFYKWFGQGVSNGFTRIYFVVILLLLITIVLLYYAIRALRRKVLFANNLLKANNERLKLALSAGELIVWGFDVKKKRYYNIECDIFPPEGRAFEDEVACFHPDEQARYRELIQLASMGQLPKEPVCFRIDYSHTEHWSYIEKEITVKRDAKGTVTDIIGTHRDITRQVMLEKRLEEERRKAEEAAQAKSEFLANISHEIRTPLNAIVGFSSLLASDEQLENPQQFVDLINQNNELLLSLINDTLDYSRLEAGMMDFHVTEFDLSEVFSNSYISLGELKRSPMVKFLCELPEKSYRMRADYHRVVQVVTNFVTNALKYTEQGYVTMSYHEEDGGVRIQVEDTGVGIAPDKVDKVFQRFEKVGSRRQGTGLGLAICRSIVEKSGGHIGVDSIKGKGSTFWAWFPSTVDRPA